MEIQILLVGTGMTIPKVNIGANILSFCTFAIRNNPAAKPYLYHIVRYPGVGGDSGSQIVGYAATEWITVNDEDKDYFAFTNLVGKIVDLEIKGTNIVRGHGDITMMLIDKFNNGKTVLSKFAVKVDSVQIGSTRIRGVIENLPKAMNFASGKITSVK